MEQITPKQLGYRMPAEWEPHAATWLSWPRRQATWPGTTVGRTPNLRRFDLVAPVYVDLVTTLSRFEPVHINAGGNFADGTSVMQQARALVDHLSNVTLHDIPTNDAWCRDHGPTFLVGPPGAPAALIDWDFNAWGGKYPLFDLDDVVPTAIGRRQGRKIFRPGIILEGGAIDVNGRGTVLTTEECLLHPNRNPRLSKTEIEQYLREYLNVSQVLWLGRGIVGDDTDGHIDELARFVNATTVVAPLEEDSRDVNHAPLRENWERLQSMRDQDGRPLDVIALPMPAAKYVDRQRLPASYCNFYIANGVVMVPMFDDPADEQALATLRPLFPDRQVIGLRAIDLVLGRGAFHCISQQEPAVAGPGVGG